jgi:hypothetical protein
MAERAGRKSYPVAVTFMSSMIWPEALRAVPVAHRRPDHHDQRATARNDRAGLAGRRILSADVWL